MDQNIFIKRHVKDGKIYLFDIRTACLYVEAEPRKNIILNTIHEQIPQKQTPNSLSIEQIPPPIDTQQSQNASPIGQQRVYAKEPSPLHQDDLSLPFK